VVGGGSLLCQVGVFNVQGAKKKNKHGLGIMTLAFVDSLRAAYLLFTSAMHFFRMQSYSLTLGGQTENVFCNFMLVLRNSLSVMSAGTTYILAYDRYHMVKNPLQVATEGKHLKSRFVYLTLGFCLSISASVVAKFGDDIQNEVCFLFYFNSSSNNVVLYTILIYVFNFTLTLAMSVLYFLIVFHLKHQDKSLSESMTRQTKVINSLYIKIPPIIIINLSACMLDIISAFLINVADFETVLPWLALAAIGLPAVSNPFIYTLSTSGSCAKK